jgi:hypothetical protein
LDELLDTGALLGDGRYFVILENDPIDPSGDPYVDSNYRLVGTCRGETPDGGVAEVGIVLAAPAFPAVVVNGDLTLPGTPDVLGPCAGVHTNGVLTVSGHPIVDGEVTSAEEVVGSGTIYNLLALDYCGQADYVLQDGWAVEVPSGASTEITGQGFMGWKWQSAQNTYSLAGNKAEPGTFCIIGNAKVTGNAGADGNPLQISIIATGSVDVGGNPKLVADHPDGILILAEGDVQISGNASGSTPAYAGLVYSGSQCQVNGTPDVGGHLLCHDSFDPPGAEDIVGQNKINGTPSVTYDCTGERRRTMIASWWESRAR